MGFLCSPFAKENLRRGCKRKGKYAQSTTPEHLPHKTRYVLLSRLYYNNKGGTAGYSPVPFFGAGFYFFTGCIARKGVTVYAINF